MGFDIVELILYGLGVVGGLVILMAFAIIYVPSEPRWNIFTRFLAVRLGIKEVAQRRQWELNKLYKVYSNLEHDPIALAALTALPLHRAIGKITRFLIVAIMCAVLGLSANRWGTDSDLRNLTWGAIGMIGGTYLVYQMGFLFLDLNESRRNLEIISDWPNMKYKLEEEIAYYRTMLIGMGVRLWG